MIDTLRCENYCKKWSSKSTYLRREEGALLGYMSVALTILTGIVEFWTSLEIHEMTSKSGFICVDLDTFLYENNVITI